MTSVATIAVLAAIWSSLFAGNEEWPPVHARCITDLFPDSDLASFEIGSDYASREHATFGRVLLPNPLRTTCISFAYDDELLDRPPLYLTVVVAEGRVKDRWLSGSVVGNPACDGLARHMVSLKGYYHARVCVGSAWE